MHKFDLLTVFSVFRELFKNYDYLPDLIDERSLNVKMPEKVNVKVPNQYIKLLKNLKLIEIDV